MRTGADKPAVTRSAGSGQCRQVGYAATAVPVAAVVRRLLHWFARHARKLPWRRRHDPYAVWVAEVMLQQTQVQTVVPYWRRWMRALPTLRALARATPQQVLKLWEGLGYYRRARNLHRAARLVVRRYHGRFPRRFEQVVALPGVGRYTAGAICSIAFNQPAPVLDGNVTRVLTRLQARSADSPRAATRRRLWRLAAALVGQAAVQPTYCSKARFGRYAGNCSMLNQALMELGATVCTPRTPRCSSCPLRSWCRGFQTGQALNLPRPRRRRPVQVRQVMAFVVSAQGRLLVRQRPAQAVNGGLWEFPKVQLQGAQPDPHTALRAWALGAAGPVVWLGCVRHTISRLRIRLHAYALRLSNRPLVRLPNSRWVTAGQLARLPLPAADRRLLDRWNAVRSPHRGAGPPVSPGPR